MNASSAAMTIHMLSATTPRRGKRPSRPALNPPSTPPTPAAPKTRPSASALFVIWLMSTTMATLKAPLSAKFATTVTARTTRMRG